MELDRSTLKKILNMSDGDLNDAVTRVALGLGLDERLLRPYLKQTEQIRAALERLTPEDLDRVTAALGEERTREVLDRIQKEVNPG